MSIDTGKAQIDQNLLDALTATGIKDSDARELARLDTFGGQSPQGWLRGLNAAATMLNKGSIILDWGTLPEPWTTCCPQLASCNGVTPQEVLVSAIAHYSTDVQLALIAAVSVVAVKLAEAATKHRQTPVKPPAHVYLKPIDPMLPKILRATLEKKGKKDQQRKRAGELLIDWLVSNGDFIRTIYGGKYYLHRATRQLLALGTGGWHTWLYRATSVNPASTDFRYLLADCDTVATESKVSEVVRCSHWDNEQQVLRVSRFDGTVYRLDGLSIEEEANGDGPAIFDDALFWQPYTPDYSAHGSTLSWTLSEIPHWENTPDECSLLLKAWWLASFFTELCPTRPILVAKGEKGSGKSMMLRVLLRLLFGPAVDVSGVPDKPDSFTALTSNSHIVVFDNMDNVTKEIRDKLAALATGKVDQVRELYTTNESRMIRYRCWLAVTSRTPDTLQRDDLVDRILILPVCRIEDQERTRESYFLMEVIKKRNCWWGDLLLVLNSVVSEIRRSGIPNRAGLRMEDWAALGTVIAATCGMSDVWENGLKEVKVRQAEFLLDDDVVVQSLEAWLSSQQCMLGTKVSTRHLFEGARSALFGVDRPDASWPRSARSFGRRLAGIRRELAESLEKSNIEMTWSQLHGELVYCFERIPLQGVLGVF